MIPCCFDKRILQFDPILFWSALSYVTDILILRSLKSSINNCTTNIYRPALLSHVTLTKTISFSKHREDYFFNSFYAIFAVLLREPEDTRKITHAPFLDYRAKLYRIRTEVLKRNIFLESSTYFNSSRIFHFSLTVIIQIEKARNNRPSDTHLSYSVRKYKRSSLYWNKQKVFKGRHFKICLGFSIYTCSLFFGNLR